MLLGDTVASLMESTGASAAPLTPAHTHTHLALFLTSCHQISMLLGVFACVYVLPPHIHPNQSPSNVRRNNGGVDSPCAAVAARFRKLLPCYPPSLTWEYPLPHHHHHHQPSTFLTLPVLDGRLSAHLRPRSVF